MTAEELKEKIKIDDMLSGMKVSILTQYHLNALGKKKSLESISYKDFRNSIFTLREFEQSHIVIYFDNRGVRCLKRKYTYEDTKRFMSHLGFEPSWSF